MPSLTLLGPQRLRPTLAGEMTERQIHGPIASITAGWQEREAEDDELSEHLGQPVVDLHLHRRLEQVFAADPELFEAHRARQDRLRARQQLYRYRLDFALEPARELLRRRAATSPVSRDDGSRNAGREEEFLQAEGGDAIDALRELDRRHLARLMAEHQSFEAKYLPLERPAIVAHRREIADLLAPASAVVIAGGHVAVLVNRMRLFGLEELLAGKQIFAWSAGAMALTERIVLFHDSPPQGMGNPEILDAGLGLLPGIVVLPHARHRLRLDDPPRVEILARRFAPAACMPFDDGESALAFEGRRYRSAGAAGRRLGVNGQVESCEAAWAPAPSRAREESA